MSFSGVAVPTDDGGRWFVEGDIKLGSIGDSIDEAEMGFSRKFKLLLDDTVPGDEMAGGTCSSLDIDGSNGFSKAGLPKDTVRGNMLASGGEYSAAADNASRPCEWRPGDRL